MYKNKLFIILLIVLSSLFLITNYSINNKNIFLGLKNILPNNFKSFIKEKIFIHKTYSITKKKYQDLSIIERKLNIKTKIYEKAVSNYEFLDNKNLRFSDWSKRKTSNNKYELISVENKFIKTLGPRSFLDEYKENLFLVTGSGHLFYSSINEYIKKINLDKHEEMYGKTDILFKKIETNLLKGFMLPNLTPEIYKLIRGQAKSSELTWVKDSLILNDKIYISFIAFNNDCFSNAILEGEINFKKIFFSKIFDTNVCNKEWHNQVGGRLSNYKDNKILLSVGDWRSIESLDAPSDVIFQTMANEPIEKSNENKKKILTPENPQNLDSLIGKIIAIDRNTYEHSIKSMGHRNPDGLFYDFKNDMIISSEHGPQGGDEINLIKNYSGKKVPNFGWPISSYGEHYGFPKSKKTKVSTYEISPLYKSHKKYGFEEPLKFFTPSVGPSQLTQVEKNNIYKIYLGTLGWKKNREGINSLHIFELDDNFEIKNHEIIDLGGRARDILYIASKDMILIYQESSGKLININEIKN